MPSDPYDSKSYSRRFCCTSLCGCFSRSSHGYTQVSTGGAAPGGCCSPFRRCGSSISSCFASLCSCCSTGDLCSKILIGFVLASVAAGLYLFFEHVKYIIAVSLAWVDRIGIFYGSLVLCAIIIFHALFLLPCLPFTLGAGFLYGCIWGSIVVHVASTVAALVGFLTSRYLARGMLERRLGAKNSKWRVIDKAIRDDGFRLVFLIRFSPLHPYGLCNYLFGLTSVTLKDYMLGSFFGMIPATVVEVYFGTALKSITDLVTPADSGNTSGAPEPSAAASHEEDSFSRLFFWGGLVVTLVVTAYMTYWVKQKLQDQLDGYELVEGAGATSNTSNAGSTNSNSNGTLTTSNSTNVGPCTQIASDKAGTETCIQISSSSSSPSSASTSSLSSAGNMMTNSSTSSPSSTTAALDDAGTSSGHGHDDDVSSGEDSHDYNDDDVDNDDDFASGTDTSLAPITVTLSSSSGSSIGSSSLAGASQTTSLSSSSSSIPASSNAANMLSPVSMSNNASPLPSPTRDRDRPSAGIHRGTKDILLERSGSGISGEGGRLTPGLGGSNGHNEGGSIIQRANKKLDKNNNNMTSTGSNTGPSPHLIPSMKLSAQKALVRQNIPPTSAPSSLNNNTLLSSSSTSFTPNTNGMSSYPRLSPTAYTPSALDDNRSDVWAGATSVGFVREYDHPSPFSASSLLATTTATTTTTTATTTATTNITTAMPIVTSSGASMTHQQSGHSIPDATINNHYSSYHTAALAFPQPLSANHTPIR